MEQLVFIGWTLVVIGVLGVTFLAALLVLFNKFYKDWMYDDCYGDDPGGKEPEEPEEEEDEEEKEALQTRITTVLKLYG